MSNSSTEIDQLNDAISDAAPRMPVSTSGEVKLLRGLYDSTTKKWHDVAVVRELTGTDEEHLAEFGTKEDVSFLDYMNEILALAVVSIGDFPIDPGSPLIEKLIIADRDLLFLGATKRSYGDEKEFRMTCGHCGQKNDVVVSLEEDFVMHFDKEFDPKTPLKVETSKGTVELRLPSSGITSKATKEGDSDSEINTYILAGCVVVSDDTTFEQSLEWARALGLKDRRKLLRALLDVRLGPEMEEVETHCSDCGKKIVVMLDWVSLLLN